MAKLYRDFLGNWLNAGLSHPMLAKNLTGLQDGSLTRPPLQDTTEPNSPVVILPLEPDQLELSRSILRVRLQSLLHLRHPHLGFGPAPGRGRLIVDAEHPVGQPGHLLQVGVQGRGVEQGVVPWIRTL